MEFTKARSLPLFSRYFLSIISFLFFSSSLYLSHTLTEPPSSCCCPTFFPSCCFPKIVLLLSQTCPRAVPVYRPVLAPEPSRPVPDLFKIRPDPSQIILNTSQIRLFHFLLCSLSTFFFMYMKILVYTKLQLLQREHLLASLIPLEWMDHNRSSPSIMVNQGCIKLLV